MLPGSGSSPRSRPTSRLCVCEDTRLAVNAAWPLQREGLSASAHFTALSAPQMIDRPARQRIIVGEEPPQHLSVVKAAIAQHGDRAGQMLHDAPVQEKLRRDAAHHRVASAHRQQLPVIE